MVKDLKPHMGHSDLIYVRERQGKFEPDPGQVLDDRIDLAAGVARGFGNVQKGFLVHEKS